MLVDEWCIRVGQESVLGSDDTCLGIANLKKLITNTMFLIQNVEYT